MNWHVKGIGQLPQYLSTQIPPQHAAATRGLFKARGTCGVGAASPAGGEKRVQAEDLPGMISMRRHGGEHRQPLPVKLPAIWSGGTSPEPPSVRSRVTPMMSSF
jgi:hypothetical protein